MPRPLVLSFVVALCLVGPLLAQPMPDGDELVIVESASENYLPGWPSAAAGADGDDFVVVWETYTGFDTTTVEGRFAGEPDFPVGDLAAVTGQRGGSEIDRAGDGRFVVVWRDFYEYAGVISAYQLKVSRLDTDGAVLGELVVDTGEYYPTTQAMGLGDVDWAPDDDSFLVVWGDADRDVVGQRYSDVGAPVGLPIDIDTDVFTIRAPQVAHQPNGDFVVTWAGSDIWARLFAADGTPQGNRFRVNSYLTGNQSYPHLGVDGDGDFVVVWAGVGGARGQRFLADGTPSGVEFDALGATTSPVRVEVEADGSFVVVGKRNGNVYSRSFEDGEVEEFTLNTRPTGNLASQPPTLARATNGDFVVAWSQFPSGDLYASVVGRKLTRRVIFEDGFESADLSAWDAIVP